MVMDFDKTQKLLNGNHQKTEGIAELSSGSDHDVAAMQSIIFLINEIEMLLPTQETLIIGRVGSARDVSLTDIDLSRFETQQPTISSIHALIKRRGSCIYVMDMFSTYGTWLNMQRIEPYVQHLLQDGDDLQLGDLQIRIGLAPLR